MDRPPKLLYALFGTSVRASPRLPEQARVDPPDLRSGRLRRAGGHVHRRGRGLRGATHVLSSGVAGTMIANKSGVQGKTLRSIALAWILTLPVSVLLAGGLYLLFRLFV